MLRTAPPFRLRPRLRPDGSLTLTHSGWQHAYAPLLLAAFFAAFCAVAFSVIGPRPTLSTVCAAVIGVAALGALLIGVCAWAWIALNSGLRLRVDPTRGLCRIEHIRPFGGVRTAHEAPLKDAVLATHDLRVVSRTRRKLRLATFRGHLLTLKAADQTFALCAAKTPDSIDRYIQDLPPPLHTLRRTIGDPIHGEGDVALF